MRMRVLISIRIRILYRQILDFWCIFNKNEQKSCKTSKHCCIKNSKLSQSSPLILVNHIKCSWFEYTLLWAFLLCFHEIQYYPELSEDNRNCNTWNSKGTFSSLVRLDGDARMGEGENEDECLWLLWLLPRKYEPSC